MRTPARLMLSLLLSAGFSLGLAPTAAFADTSDFTFDWFDAEYTLNTSVSGVTDQNGTPVFFESYTSGGFVELALGTDEFVRGVQSYVITYTQQNVVRSFDDTASDEFYWDINGTGWQQPFGRVRR